MKSIRLFALSFLAIALLMVMLPVPVFASHDAAQSGSVIASAVIVPAHITKLGFPITAPVKELTVKEGDVVITGQTLVTLNTPDLAYAVTAADAAHRSAEAYAALQRYKKVRHFINGKEVWQDAPPEVRKIADAQALSAYSRLETAQFTYAQTSIVAPYDATVVDIHASIGEVAQQGQPVIALATLNNMTVETTDLSERDITKIRVGAPVEISVEALNEVFTGKVIRIAPKANIVGGDVVFKVTIAFDIQPKGLLWGMTAEVTIGE